MGVRGDFQVRRHSIIPLDLCLGLAVVVSSVVIYLSTYCDQCIFPFLIAWYDSCARDWDNYIVMLSLDSKI